jgi:hypothetical protein
MARKLEVSATALRDIEQMRSWLSQPGTGPRAKERRRRIQNAIRELTQDPVRWSIGVNPGTRERIVEEYVIVYMVSPDTNDRRTAGDVYIVRLYGPGQERPN